MSYCYRHTEKHIIARLRSKIMILVFKKKSLVKQTTRIEISICVKGNNIFPSQVTTYVPIFSTLFFSFMYQHNCYNVLCQFSWRYWHFDCNFDCKAKWEYRPVNIRVNISHLFQSSYWLFIAPFHLMCPSFQSVCVFLFSQCVSFFSVSVCLSFNLVCISLSI